MSTDEQKNTEGAEAMSTDDKPISEDQHLDEISAEIKQEVSDNTNEAPMQDQGVEEKKNIDEQMVSDRIDSTETTKVTRPEPPGVIQNDDNEDSVPPTDAGPFQEIETNHLPPEEQTGGNETTWQAFQSVGSVREQSEVNPEVGAKVVAETNVDMESEWQDFGPTESFPKNQDVVTTEATNSEKKENPSMDRIPFNEEWESGDEMSRDSTDSRSSENPSTSRRRKRRTKATTTTPPVVDADLSLLDYLNIQEPPSSDKQTNTTAASAPAGVTVETEVAPSPNSQEEHDTENVAVEEMVPEADDFDPDLELDEVLGSPSSDVSGEKNSGFIEDTSVISENTASRSQQPASDDEPTAKSAEENASKSSEELSLLEYLNVHVDSSEDQEQPPEGPQPTSEAKVGSEFPPGEAETIQEPKTEEVPKTETPLPDSSLKIESLNINDKIGQTLAENGNGTIPQTKETESGAESLLEYLQTQLQPSENQNEAQMAPGQTSESRATDKPSPSESQPSQKAEELRNTREAPLESSDSCDTNEIVHQTSSEEETETTQQPLGADGEASGTQGNRNVLQVSQPVEKGKEATPVFPTEGAGVAARGESDSNNEEEEPEPGQVQGCQPKQETSVLAHSKPPSPVATNQDGAPQPKKHPPRIQVKKHAPRNRRVVYVKKATSADSSSSKVESTTTSNRQPTVSPPAPKHEPTTHVAESTETSKQPKVIRATRSESETSPSPKTPTPREPEESVLHLMLKTARWKELLKAMEKLKEKEPSFVTKELIKVDKDSNATPLHTAVWKAPLQLTKLLLSIIPSESRKEILLHQDVDGNTPLHLACANLERKADNTVEPSIVKILALGAPEAQDVPNQQGDIPLALLVTAPAVEASRDPAEKLKQAESVIEEIVRTTLTQRPNLASSQNKHGMTLLHAAASHRAHEKVLSTLLELTGFAEQVDDAGRLPLHYVAACISGQSPPAAFAERLVDAFPRGIVSQCSTGDTPLHLLVSNLTSKIETEEGRATPQIQRLTRALMGDHDNEHMCPLLIQNGDALNPLHCCALFTSPPSVAKILMDSPFAVKAASMKDSHEATPLHLLCGSSSIDTLVDLLEALGTFESSLEKDGEERTPLHVALENLNVTQRIVEILVDLNPQACREATSKGRMPLHVALRMKAADAIIKVLVRANPKAVKSVFDGDNTIFHEMCQYRTPASVVRDLLLINPDGAKKHNKFHNLPLHVAAAYQCDVETIKLLVEAYPEACSHQNKNEDAPIHYASSYKKDPDVLKALVEANPASVVLVNDNGETPLARAIATGVDQRVIKMMKKAAKGVGKSSSSKDSADKHDNGDGDRKEKKKDRKSKDAVDKEVQENGNEHTKEKKKEKKSKKKKTKKKKATAESDTDQQDSIGSLGSLDPQDLKDSEKRFDIPSGSSASLDPEKIHQSSGSIDMEKGQGSSLSKKGRLSRNNSSSSTDKKSRLSRSHSSSAADKKGRLSRSHSSSSDRQGRLARTKSSSTAEKKSRLARTHSASSERDDGKGRRSSKSSLKAAESAETGTSSPRRSKVESLLPPLSAKGAGRETVRVKSKASTFEDDLRRRRRQTTLEEDLRKKREAVRGHRSVSDLDDARSATKTPRSKKRLSVDNSALIDAMITPQKTPGSSKKKGSLKRPSSTGRTRESYPESMSASMPSFPSMDDDDDDSPRTSSRGRGATDTMSTVKTVSRGSKSADRSKPPKSPSAAVTSTGVQRRRLKGGTSKATQQQPKSAQMGLPKTPSAAKQAKASSSLLDDLLSTPMHESSTRFLPPVWADEEEEDLA